MFNRFLSFLATGALVAALGTAGFAATSSPAPSMMSAKTTTSCPTGETYVKGYTKSDGTKVAGYCRKSSSSMMSSTSCPKGETWVAPYKKSDGTMVKGYCRKSPAPAATK